MKSRYPRCTTFGCTCTYTEIKVGVVNKMKRLLRYIKDEEGVAGIEQGLIAAMIAALITIVIIVAVATIVVKRLEKRPGGGARLQRGG